MLNRTLSRRLSFTTLFGVLLAGCSFFEAEGVKEDVAQRAAVPLPDQLPPCDDIAKSIGAPIAALRTMPSSEPEKWRDGDKHGVLCTWGTDTAIRAEQGQVNSISDIQNVGTVTLQISVNDNVMVESDARSVSRAFDDPRAKAIGGWIMADSNLDLAGKLGMAPPQVNVGVTTISIGVANNSAPELNSITNDWAIDAAVKVHRMIDS